MSERIAIVDPFFSGAGFRESAQKMGYEVICIQSNMQTNPPPIKDSFSFHFVFDGNLDKLISLLQPLSVKALFAGCETGVLLADILSEKLGLITNGMTFSRARRDKGVMKTVFKERHIPCADFLELEQPSVHAILEWMERTGQKYPIVLKPAAAFGSMNVFICSDLSELKLAVEALKTQDLSSFGVTERKMLAEEFIDGDEYAIDFIGDGKNQYVTDAWKYERREFTKGRNAYYSITLLDPDDRSISFRNMVEVAGNAVSALQIRYGCSHVELKLDSHDQVKILEVGARIAGANLAKLAIPVTGQNTEKAHIQTFLGETLDFLPTYALEEYVALATLKTERSGTIVSFQGIDAIKSLSSFKELSLHYKIGSAIEPTVDLVQRPGSVVLQAKDQALLQAHIKACHELFAINVL